MYRSVVLLKDPASILFSFSSTHQSSDGWLKGTPTQYLFLIWRSCCFCFSVIFFSSFRGSPARGPLPPAAAFWYPFEGDCARRDSTPTHGQQPWSCAVLISGSWSIIDYPFWAPAKIMFTLVSCILPEAPHSPTFPHFNHTWRCF